MKRIYIFSGLGADQRVFKDLDFSGFEVTFMGWIRPQPSETIQGYAKRLPQQITTVRPVLIGLSFGGVMAVEVAKLIETTQVILISSAKTRLEIPPCYQLAGKLRLHKLLPTALLKRSNGISDWFFGVQRAEDKELLAAILRDTDNQFLRWAIDKIVTWTNQTSPRNLTHIHGTADKMLPFRYVVSNLTVTGGGHFMTVTEADELTQVIRDLLQPDKVIR